MLHQAAIVQNVVNVQIRNINCKIQIWARSDNGMRIQPVVYLILACKYIAQIVRALVYVLLIGIIVPNMIIPPSNGHSPEGLLFMGTLAIFLFSTVKLQLKFYDMLFFMISLALLLTFQIWSTALLEWLYKEKGLL